VPEISRRVKRRRKNTVEERQGRFRRAALLAMFCGLLTAFTVLEKWKRNVRFEQRNRPLAPLERLRKASLRGAAKTGGKIGEISAKLVWLAASEDSNSVLGPAAAR
jgi:hypothetical protein